MVKVARDNRNASSGRGFNHITVARHIAWIADGSVVCLKRVVWTVDGSVVYLKRVKWIADGSAIREKPDYSKAGTNGERIVRER